MQLRWNAESVKSTTKRVFAKIAKIVLSDVFWAETRTDGLYS